MLTIGGLDCSLFLEWAQNRNMAGGERAWLEGRHVEGVQIFSDRQESGRDHEIDKAETDFRDINSWAICSEERLEMLNGNDAASVDVDKVHPVDAHIGCSTLSEAVGI
jgi:hypothetical protein